MEEEKGSAGERRIAQRGCERQTGGIRIESDGTGKGTHVIDKKTGKGIRYVKSIDIHIEAGKINEAVITLLLPDLEIDVEEAVVRYEQAERPTIR